MLHTVRHAEQLTASYTHNLHTDVLLSAQALNQEPATFLAQAIGSFCEYYINCQNQSVAPELTLFSNTEGSFTLLVTVDDGLASKYRGVYDLVRAQCGQFDSPTTTIWSNAVIRHVEACERNPSFIANRGLIDFEMEQNLRKPKPKRPR